MWLPIRRTLPLLLTACLISGLAGAAFAEDSTSDDIEINLDALDMLPPARDEGRPDPSTVGTQPVLMPPPPDTAGGNTSDGPATADTPPTLDDTATTPTTTAAPDLPGAPSGGDPLAAQTTPDSVADKADEFALTLMFSADTDTLDLTGSQQLDTFANRLRDVPGRITLNSFAGDRGDPPSLNGRKALKRAIALRGYLMDRGIPGSRIDLRPQGAAEKGSAPERVDLKFSPQ